MTFLGYVVWTDNMRIKIIAGDANKPIFTIYGDSNPDHFKRGDKVTIEITRFIKVA